MSTLQLTRRAQMREDARELAQERVERGIDDALDFYEAALAVGASLGQADDIRDEIESFLECIRTGAAPLASSE